MAKRRKLGHPLALAVMVLLAERSVHPYEIAQTLRRRGKEHSVKINFGSLFTVVQNPEKHGYVEVAGVQRQGNRPERTLYGITEAGRVEMLDWLSGLLAVPAAEHPVFETALSESGAHEGGQDTRADRPGGGAVGDPGAQQQDGDDRCAGPEHGDGDAHHVERWCLPSVSEPAHRERVSPGRGPGLTVSPTIGTATPLTIVGETVTRVGRCYAAFSCSRSTCAFHSRLTERQVSSFWPSRQ
ncbi:PadR family transcriptional regulator [Streptomyces sp. NBC_00846]|uniref:PadR family transcriptional regulator n=1 Tax=Streptomyces sp. NBC_00846 TaxID=2975849 RepID=UPI00386875B3|nr:PadR family transcriptional regulator [Streptomyces sp. NBC_00846]